ncbi:MAG: extracellular solute-binding protein [Lachnospiraceae bacterium]|jgi:ABC-type glycerol-3-phosphate transport system substrate-binding protein|nr:extracellular solute-binding protein [Lachnospiraceae bacterium]
MKRKKKLIFIIAAISLLAVMAGCAGCSKGDEIASKDYVFRLNELPASAAYPDGAEVFVAGDVVYMQGSVWDANYSNRTMRLSSLDNDGNIVQQVEYIMNSNTYYISITGANDGRIFAIKSVSPSFNDDFNVDDNFGRPVTPRLQLDGVPDFGMMMYYLVELGLDGNERELALLNDNSEWVRDGYISVNQLITLPNDTLLLGVNDAYAIFGFDGSYQGLMNIDFGDNTYGGTLIPLRDGRIVSTSFSFDGTNMVLRELNPADGSLGREYELSGNVWGYTFHPGVGYDFFVSDSNNVYGYNLGGELVKLMNYIDSDVITHSISNLLAFSPDLFWAQIFDNVTWRPYFAMFTKVDPKDVQDKTAITLAGTSIDWDVRGRVVNFNRNNDQYRIVLVDYSSQYNTASDWMAGANRLNADIAAGRIPDILIVSWDLPIASYAAKGLFADLLPYIEKDPELLVSDLLPNVVEAYSINGKMYRLMPHFVIETVIGKASLVGTEPGWTLEEAMALHARMPSGTSLFDLTIDRATLLRAALAFGGNQYVDWVKGECHFNEPGFIHLLEFLKGFPETIDYSALMDDPDYWMNWDSNYRMDRVLLMMTGINNFQAYNRNEKGMFGETVTAIGFPSDAGIGAVVNTYSVSFAMSQRGSNQDGAWEFLREYLSDEYQESQAWLLPINRRILEQRAEEAMKKPFWTDGDGNRYEYDETHMVDGVEVIIPPMSRAEVDKLLNYIYSVNGISELNDQLLEIIEEEAASFFAGQKTVQEVVTIIQSRAQIYVNEIQ